VSAFASSATLLGIRGRPVVVQAHVANGPPSFRVVGLPDDACREARGRVRPALLSSGLSWPSQNVTVNLAVAEGRPSDAGLDLEIALCLLVATGDLDAALVAGCAVVGELGLDGTIRSASGDVALGAALSSKTLGWPAAHMAEALLVARPLVHRTRSLRDLVDALLGRIDYQA
jgi:magnesium chelatase family protein